MKKVLMLALLCLLSPWALAKPPQPLLWKVSDDDNSVYLLGSMHLLKADDYPPAAVVQQAFDAAEQVYFEIAPEEMDDQQRTQALVTQRAIYPGEQTLRQHLRPETWNKLEKYRTSRQIPAGRFEKFEPWFLALVISVAEMQQAGLKAEFGLDKYFARLAKSANKPTGAFETLDEQFVFFDSMSAEEQEQVLLQTLGEVQDMQRRLDGMHTAWRNGDAERLYKLLSDEMVKEAPKLYRRIVVDRNKAWLPKIAELLNASEQHDALVVVGSLHLLGDDGLVKLLSRQGYRVERLQ